MTPINYYIAAFITIILAFVVSSYSKPRTEQKLVDYVDIDRFMGKWYVHGYVPTFLDKNAFGATETYELDEDGKIRTTYNFRKGGPEGKVKTYKPTARVSNTESNAEWKMRFFKIFNIPYYILYLYKEYNNTIIGHPEKKYAWIMSREPMIVPEIYSALKSELEQRDYNLKNFKQINHQDAK